MMTNERIASEIEALLEEAKKKLAAAKNALSEFTQLRVEAGCLERILRLRGATRTDSEPMSYGLIGSVWEEEDEDHPKPFCALTWAGTSDSPSCVEIFLKSDWRSAIPAEVVSYFDELRRDWEKLIVISPGTVVSAITDLSVGPIRTIARGTMAKEKLHALLAEKLGPTVRTPPGDFQP